MKKEMSTPQITAVLPIQKDVELIEQMRWCMEIVEETQCGFFLTISGFDFDERETFEIPEVVDLCQRLCKIGFPSVLWPTTWIREFGDVGVFPQKDAARVGMGAFEVWAIAVGLIAERRSSFYFPRSVVMQFFEKELPQIHKRCVENLETPPDLINDRSLKSMTTTPNNTLSYTNDGPDITETNFWETEFNERGLIFCSINAGCFRLLLPNRCNGGVSEHLVGIENIVTEMRTGKQATICRGAMPVIRSNDAIEITFDDGSLNPYRLFLDLRQFDRLPGEEDHNRDDLRLAVYTKGPQKVLVLPAKYVNEFQVSQNSGD